MAPITVPIIAFLLLVGPVAAAPLTVACALESTTTRATRFIEVDQFVFDFEAESMDMRSARTMGTSDPVNWLYVTRKDTIFDDVFALRKYPDGQIAGGGIAGGVPTAFNLNVRGALLMTYIVPSGGAETITWQCLR